MQRADSLEKKNPDAGKIEGRRRRGRQRVRRLDGLTDLMDTSLSKLHNGVITHLEPDILDCEVKWALESITRNKATGGDGIPAELFQILKDDAVKVLHSICQQIWKIQQWPQDWKRSVFILIPKKGFRRKDLEKAKEPEIKLPTSTGS